MAEFSQYDKEVQNFVSGGKNKLKDAISQKGGSFTGGTTPTFQKLNDEINGIKVGSGHDVSIYYFNSPTPNWTYNNTNRIIKTDTNWSAQDIQTLEITYFDPDSTPNYQVVMFESEKGWFNRSSGTFTEASGFSMNNGELRGVSRGIKGIVYGIIVHK